MREYHNTNESSQGSKKGEEEKDGHDTLSSDMRRNGEFSERIESLGKVLKPNQKASNGPNVPPMAKVAPKAMASGIKSSSMAMNWAA
jgi:hypothetical protein